VTSALLTLQKIQAPRLVTPSRPVCAKSTRGHSMSINLQQPDKPKILPRLLAFLNSLKSYLCFVLSAIAFGIWDLLSTVREGCRLCLVAVLNHPISKMVLGLLKHLFKRLIVFLIFLYLMGSVLQTLLGA